MQTPTIVTKSSRSVTVKMSISRWKRYQQLEASYIVESHVLKGRKDTRTRQVYT